MRIYVQRQKKKFVFSPHGLEYQTEVVLVEEVSEEAHAVEPVVRVCFVELLEDAQFLEARLVHHLVVADDLDGHLLVGLEGVPGTDHVAEHALARVAVHSVAPVQLLAHAHTWK